MRILIDALRCPDRYTMTERRTMSRVGECLEAVGATIDFSPWHTLTTLSAYDVCIWNHEDVIAEMQVLPGYDTCINLLYSNGRCRGDLPIEGVLYSQAAFVASSPYHAFLLHGPFQRIYPRVERPDLTYILISGPFVQQRGLHLPLLATVLANRRASIKLVCQSSRDRLQGQHTWLYSEIFETYAKLASQVVSVEQLQVQTPRDFQDMLRHASIYIFCDQNGMNPCVCLEALLYGIPLIAPANPIDYTTDYYAYAYGHDWLSALSIAEHINAILQHPSDARKRSMRWARDHEEEFSYRHIGAGLVEFIESISNGKSNLLTV